MTVPTVPVAPITTGSLALVATAVAGVADGSSARAKRPPAAPVLNIAADLRADPTKKMTARAWAEAKNIGWAAPRGKA